jgi:asparagine synthase (glutamine-hydrolysing)
MCGIAGIVGRIGDSNREALRRMNAAMVHRGPDAGATWESAADPGGQGVLLGHRRLAILDLSPAGSQPMVDPATADVVVYNGEIYNYPELRARLAAGGHRLQSSGDTAVMLRHLSLRGHEAIRSFRGMFAFAHWSRARRELLLARDPLGMKPLYLATNPDPQAGWSLAFASEVRALLASGLLGRPRLDPRAAASVTWNGFVVGPSTAVDGVESVWPGEWRTYDALGRQLAARRYWTARRSGDAPAMDEDELSSLLQEGVRLHLASDVPLAVFLSGGVDSSAVANLAQRASAAPIHTFTLAFEEEEFNEGHVARRIAGALGTSHREVTLTEKDFVRGLDAALDSLDQPTIDGINSYVLSQAIRRAGFTVALAGTGGDELFGGYASFRDLPVLHRWLRRSRWLPRSILSAGAKAALAAFLPPSGAFPAQTRWAKLADMVRRPELLSLYQLAYALFLPDFQERLLGPAAGTLEDGLPPGMREALQDEARERTPLSAISVFEQRLFLGDRLLRDNDVASMAASIEQRLPLVDQALFEAVDALPDAARYDPVGKKALLRRIGLRGLDPALFDRPKRGFLLPYDRWIRAGLQGAMDRTLRDPAAVRAAGLEPGPVAALWQAFLDRAPGLYWTRVWALFVLARWCERHGVRA